MRKPVSGISDQTPQEVEGLYYPCSENKDADQLRGYREADLRLCFRILHVSLAIILLVKGELVALF